MPVITQPASVKGAVVGSPNLFGAPPNNSNRQPLNHNNYIQTNDATPVNNLLSPQAVIAGTPTPLVTPPNAVTLTIVSSTAVQISEFANMSQFATLPAGVPITLDVARQGVVYLQAPAAGTPSVSFFYQTL